MPHKTLIITGRQIRKLVDIGRAVGIVERAFFAHGTGRVQMPPKLYIHLDRYNGDFRAMPVYIATMDACGIKWVNVHPRNRRLGLPTVMATILLSDPHTGSLLAVMDGTYVTSIRTGASGAVAAKYLARKGSSTAAFVGCGAQALYQFLALASIFKLTDISLYDTDPLQARRLARSIRRSGISARICATVKACVSERDVVVTTTPSRKPIIKSSWISPGTHINAIGADAKGKQELETALLKRAKVVIDDIRQSVHSGEINVPISKRQFRASEIHSTLGRIVAGKATGRRSAEEVTVFDSTGLAIQDIAVASYIYRKIRSAHRTGRSIGVDFR